MTWNLAAAYLTRDPRSDGLLAGTALGLTLTEQLSLQSGLQLLCPFDGGSECSAAAVLSISLASVAHPFTLMATQLGNSGPQRDSSAKR